MNYLSYRKCLLSLHFFNTEYWEIDHFWSEVNGRPASIQVSIRILDSCPLLIRSTSFRLLWLLVFLLFDHFWALFNLNDLATLTLSLQIVSCLIVLFSSFDLLFNLFRTNTWVWDRFVIHFLIAGLAQATWMMRPILVYACRRLPLVALAQVAEVAHEFGTVLTVVMLTDAEER